MRLISFVAANQRARHRRTAIVLLVAVAVTGGVSLALLGGARRASDVVARYYAPAIPYDLTVDSSGLTRDQMLKMPGVVRADRQAYIGGLSTRPDGTTEVLNVTAGDGPPWDPMIRLRAGAMPVRSDGAVMAVNQRTLDDFGIHVGDSLKVRLFLSESDYAAIQAGKPTASGAQITMTVSGLIDAPDEFEAGVVKGGSQQSNFTVGYVPFSFYEQHVASGDMADFGYGFAVVLHDPAQVAAFQSAVTAASAALPQPMQPSFGPGPWAPRQTTLESPARVQAIVLLALALLTLVAGLVVIALVMTGAERLFRYEAETQRALGMVRRQRAMITPRRWADVVVGGSVLAALIAVALSGLFPVGTTSPLEREPGIRLDVAVVIGGMLLLVVVTGALAVLVGIGSTRPERAPKTQPPSAAGSWWSTHAPLEFALGWHLAFPRRGSRGAGLVRQAAVAGAVAIALVLVVAQYDGRVDHLHESRPAHGFNWDLAIGNSNFLLTDEAQAVLRADTRLSDVVPALYGQAVIGGQNSEVFAFGSTGNPDQFGEPTIVHGRAPVGANEIALGAHLLHRLGVKLGDTVSFSLPPADFAAPQGSGVDAPTAQLHDLTLTVVGTTVVPTAFGTFDLAESAAVPMAAIQAAGAPAAAQLMLARFAPGVDRAQVVDSLRHQYPLWITTDDIPAKVHSLWRGRFLPAAGALVMAMLAVLLLGYTLTTVGRLRRRELAVLRVLGMRAGGLRRAVMWQGVAVAAVMLLVGLPVGAIAGGFAWRAVASQLGVSNRLGVSPYWLITVPAVVIFAVVAASLPARSASRLRVAEALRVE